jgi:hypothetical protein
MRGCADVKGNLKVDSQDGFERVDVQLRMMDVRPGSSLPGLSLIRRR